MRYQIDDINRYVRRIYGSNPVLVTPFGYPVTFTSPTVPVSFTVQANADFILTRLAYSAMIDTPGVQVGQKRVAAFMLTIRESGSKEPFTDSPVMLENYCGNGVEGRDLDYPRFLAGGSTVELSLDNTFEPLTFAGGIELYLSGMMVRVFGK